MKRAYLMTLTPRYALFLVMALALLALTFIPNQLAAHLQAQETSENGTSLSLLQFYRAINLNGGALVIDGKVQRLSVL